MMNKNLKFLVTTEDKGDIDSLIRKIPEKMSRKYNFTEKVLFLPGINFYFRESVEHIKGLKIDGILIINPDVDLDKFKFILNNCKGNIL